MEKLNSEITNYLIFNKYIDMVTIQNLYLENLSISELKSLLPAYRSDVQDVIVNYINFLESINT